MALIGENRRDVRIVARIQATADYYATANAIACQIRIFTDGGVMRSEGPSNPGHASWSVSYDVYVPSQANLEADTENGGISAEKIQGEMDLEATNGGIHRSDVGGKVRARTTNGGVTADLSGTTWQGKGLDSADDERRRHGVCTARLQCAARDRNSQRRDASGLPDHGAWLAYPAYINAAGVRWTESARRHDEWRSAHRRALSTELRGVVQLTSNRAAAKLAVQWKTSPPARSPGIC